MTTNFAIMGLLLLMATGSSQPIPDSASLLKQIQEHQRKMDELREKNYTFREMVRTDELDAKGNVGKTTTREREVFYVNGRRVGRLIRKDGVDLSASERKREQARVDDLVKNRMKRPAAYGSGGDIRLITELLVVAKVSQPRRLSLNGRSTLMFDFTRDPKAHAQGFEQNIAKKLSGTIWIDEADLQVARLEVLFDDNFRLGGFLASVQKGTTVEIEQSPIGEGLWMQTSSKQHIAARILVKGMHANNEIHDTEFKKFDAGVLERIDSPK